MTTTQWILIGGFVLMYIGQTLSHFSHKKTLQNVGADLQAIGQKVEQNAPAIASAIVQTGLVAEVKPEQK